MQDLGLHLRPQKQPQHLLVNLVLQTWEDTVNFSIKIFMLIIQSAYSSHLNFVGPPVKSFNDNYHLKPSLLHSIGR